MYGVEITGNGKPIRFGSTLTEGEKDWLVVEIRGLIDRLKG